MHLIVIAVPVPQIQEQIVDVIKVIPEEWMSKRTVRQTAQTTEKPSRKENNMSNIIYSLLLRRDFLIQGRLCQDLGVIFAELMYSSETDV